MAWKNFQNGYPLYASELNNYLMKQSVAVFVDAAERTSVLTAPVEGQVTWLQSTNAFQVYNGSAWVDINDNTDAIQKSLLTTAGDTIYATGSATPARLALGSTGSILKANGSAPAWLAPGTSGQVLSSTGSDLAWTTPAGGGSMTLLSTTTLSGGSVTISGISTAYKSLYITIEGITLAANGSLNIRPNSSSTICWGAIIKSSTATTTTIANAELDVLGGNFLLATGANNFITITIQNYASTSRAKSWYSASMYNGSAALNGNGGFGGINTTSAITSINFQTSSTFSGGTVIIYGVN